MITAIAALSGELTGIRRHLRRSGSLNLSKSSNSSGNSSGSGDVVVGRLAGQDCVLVQSGMGRERAERALRYVLQHYRPTAVLSLGFCGALAAALRVGDLVLCSPITALSALPAPLRPVPLEGELHCDSSLVNLALRVTPPPLRGGCLTLPGVASDPRLKEWLSVNTTSAVVDMESFWLGRLAEKAGVPFLVVRSVSDLRTESLPPLDELVDDWGHVKLRAHESVPSDSPTRDRRVRAPGLARAKSRKVPYQLYPPVPARGAVNAAGILSAFICLPRLTRASRPCRAPASGMSSLAAAAFKCAPSRRLLVVVFFLLFPRICRIVLVKTPAPCKSVVQVRRRSLGRGV